MKIYLLEASHAKAAHNVLVGIFTSKIKANKAWKLWTGAFEGTIWEKAEKHLWCQVADEIYLFAKKIKIKEKKK